MNTYTKLNQGDWGLRVQGRAEAGQTVTVTTKAGKSKPEKIGKVLWTGADRQTGDTVSLCTIDKRNDDGGRASDQYNSGAGYRVTKDGKHMVHVQGSRGMYWREATARDRFDEFDD